MAQSSFQQSLKAVATQPYRKLVSDRIRGRTPEALADAVRAAQDRVPERLHSCVPLFLEAARDKFLQSKLFWEASTCREALANILELAAEVIEDDEVWQCHKSPLADDGVLAGVLFDLATASFVEAAALSADQRRLMGIKKGWLR